jgi:putative DNA primase/helicase
VNATVEQVGAYEPPPALQWAARLVVLGVNVIPVGRDKRPLGTWKRWQTGRQVELPHPDDDAFLLEHFDRRVNLAAVTGKVSEIVVLDADSRSAWDALVDVCGGSIPRTVIANTAKGRHVWFAHPGGEIRNTVRLGNVPLDVRGDGGFVVTPPSIHPSGKPYTWHRSPLECWPPAPLPQRLLELLRPTARAVKPMLSVPERGHGSRYAETALRNEVDAVRSATVGARNDSLNRSAYSLARFIESGELRASDVAHALVYAARAAGLSEQEARRTVASGISGRGA